MDPLSHKHLRKDVDDGGSCRGGTAARAAAPPQVGTPLLARVLLFSLPPELEQLVTAAGAAVDNGAATNVGMELVATSDPDAAGK